MELMKKSDRKMMKAVKDGWFGEGRVTSLAQPEPKLSTTQSFIALMQGNTLGLNAECSNPKKIIAMKGVACSGKSVIALHIAKWMKCPVVSIDDFLEALSIEKGYATSPPPPMGEEAERLRRLALYALYKSADRHLDSYSSVVIKSRLCTEFELDLLMWLAKENRCISLVIIECKVKHGFDLRERLRDVVKRCRDKKLKYRRRSGRRDLEVHRRKHASVELCAHEDWYKATSWEELEEAREDYDSLESQASWDLRLLRLLYLGRVSHPTCIVTRLVLNPFDDLKLPYIEDLHDDDDDFKLPPEFLNVVAFLLVRHIWHTRKQREEEEELEGSGEEESGDELEGSEEDSEEEGEEDDDSDELEGLEEEDEDSEEEEDDEKLEEVEEDSEEEEHDEKLEKVEEGEEDSEEEIEGKLEGLEKEKEEEQEKEGLEKDMEDTGKLERMDDEEEDDELQGLEEEEEDDELQGLEEEDDEEKEEGVDSEEDPQEDSEEEEDEDVELEELEEDLEEEEEEENGLNGSEEEEEGSEEEIKGKLEGLEKEKHEEQEKEGLEKKMEDTDKLEQIDDEEDDDESEGGDDSDEDPQVYLVVQFDELRQNLLKIHLRNSMKKEKSKYLCSTTKGESCVFRYWKKYLAYDAEEETVQNCQVCKMQVDAGNPAYTCHYCFLILHESCAMKLDLNCLKHTLDLEEAIYYPNFRYVDLLSSLKVHNACKSCIEGGKDFSESCASCLFQTHLINGMMPTILKHDSHPHFLSLRFLPEYFHGSEYGCYLCNFYIDFDKVLLPREVKDKHGGYEHAMKLMYSLDGKGPEDDYWCQRNYGDMRADAWFYSCQQCPYYIFTDQAREKRLREAIENQNFSFRDYEPTSKFNPEMLTTSSD